MVIFGRIIWNKTVIYHVFDNTVSGKKELRRTVFQPRDNDMSPTDRQAQIDDVAGNGVPDTSADYYLDWDVKHVEMFLRPFPCLMHFSGPRLQLIDVFISHDHRGRAVSQFPYPKNSDDGIRDPWFFVVESLHQLGILSSDMNMLA